MSPKIKNIIIFVAIAVVLILIYVFFIKKGPEQAPLTSSTTPVATLPGAAPAANNNISDQNSAIAADFLALLLNVKSVALDDSIFSDPAFTSLQDSSIELVPDGTQGRPNPFAPIGADVIAAPTTGIPPVGTTTNVVNPVPAPTTPGGGVVIPPQQAKPTGSGTSTQH